MSSHFPLSVNSLRSGRSLSLGIWELATQSATRSSYFSSLGLWASSSTTAVSSEDQSLPADRKIPFDKQNSRGHSKTLAVSRKKKNDGEPKRHKDKEGKCENLAFGSHVYGPQGKRPSIHWAPSAAPLGGGPRTFPAKC